MVSKSIYKRSSSLRKPALRFRAQVSIEYLIIIGVSFAILIPGAYFFYSYSKSSNEATIRSEITQMGNTMITNTESIYGLSEGSIITLDMRYPDNIRDIYMLGGKELVIKYELSSGMNEAVFFSKITLSGNYYFNNRSICSPPCSDSTITNKTTTQPGSHQLRFESKAHYVLISQAK